MKCVKKQVKVASHEKYVSRLLDLIDLDSFKVSVATIGGGGCRYL